MAAERLRAADRFEELKAWGHARAEYAKLQRLNPGSAAAREALDRTPAPNEKAVTGAKLIEILGTVAKVAAAKHADLARWCARNGRAAKGLDHWETVLLYVPGDKDALEALGLVGKGHAAVHGAWKGVDWSDHLCKADGGKPLDVETDVERKWDVKTETRQSATLRWEGIGVSQ